MGAGDPHLATVGRPAGGHASASKHDCAGVRCQRARQDVQEGGLAGAVGPDDADRLTFLEREVDAVQHGKGAEALANVDGGENRRIHG